MGVTGRLTRRAVLGRGAAALLLGQHWSACSRPHQRGGADRPNIIVILSDDQGYSDLGVYGCADIPTPNIDSLAERGVRFTNSYVSCPYCSPSRAGLLTGRYQERFGHEFNTHSTPYFLKMGGDPSKAGLPLTETTLADRLRESGYVTGAVGKWHLGEAPQYHPLKRGFREFYGFLGGGRSYFPQSNLGAGSATILRNYEPVPWDGYLTDVLGSEASSFIDRHRNEPFFLYLAPNAVHSPMEAPQRYLNRFPEIRDEPRHTYAGMLLALDDAVGKVLGKIREAGLEDKTLIFFLSDNGGPTKKGASTGSRNGPLRGSKCDTWEGGIRVPMLVQWKGKLTGKRVYDKPVIQLDIAATALAAAGVQVKPEWKLDGVNLLPYLTGDHQGDPHRVLFWRFGEHMAVRMGDWKVARSWDNDTPQLFNLREDLGESRDLAKREPEKFRELMAAWKAWDAELIPPQWPMPEGDYPARGIGECRRETPEDPCP
ncbi:MAG: sulfatase-like hydrolase/transferase [Acidobacteria bacterium]|nr:sulfatase-like hydrolase/transferase [Acidobacteriota bacterium]